MFGTPLALEHGKLLVGVDLVLELRQESRPSGRR